MTDFFISYNKADKAWAEWIAWQLEEAKYTTVLQAWDITPGTNFVLKMHEAAKEAERTIAVLSPDYLTSIFTAPEWAAAFAQDPTGEKGLLIPLRIRKCDPEGLLGQIVFQDIAGLGETAAKSALLTAVKRGRAKPEAKPAFPPTAGRSITSHPRFPGSLPPIWNVPYRRNPNFTGREELLVSLHASLTSGTYAALTQAMHGLGGVGKTQTAVEYAHRYATEYDAVLWVPAEDPAALAAHFAGLANEIGLDVDPADQPAAVNAVQRWLRGNSRWLLVFDNAEAATDIQSYLPHAGTGHVIITSRNPEWKKVAKPLAVKVFAPEEAIEFLLVRTGRDAGGEEERAAVAALSEELGGLALALEQAAAYIETHGLSIADYLRLFRKHREEVLSRDRSPDYPHTIETVWAISFMAVEETNQDATELLSLLAFLAPDDIPLTLLRSNEESLGGFITAITDELKLQEALRIVRRHSLAEVTEDGISVHRVVQEVTRRSLSSDQRKLYASIALKAVHAALPKDPRDVSNWPIYHHLAPHVLAVAQHCEQERTDLVLAGYCLNDMGRYLKFRADYGSAKPYLEQATRIAQDVFGPAHPNVASCLINVGGVLQALGDHAAARSKFAEALRIDEAVLEPNDPKLAIDLTNLGAALRHLGELPQALECQERALRIDEAALGPEDPEVATDVSNLGLVYQALGELERARSCFERALRIDEAALGPAHINCGRDLNNMGGVQWDLGDLHAARASFERALAITESGVGIDHPDAANVARNLSVLLFKLGDFEGSGMFAARAAMVFRRYLGDEHPTTQNVVELLTDVMLKLEK